MVEQPKSRVALAASKMRSKSDEKQERADQERRKEPDLPGKFEQNRDDDDTAKPKRDAGGLRAPVRLDVKIGGNDPKKRGRERAEHAKLGIAGNVMTELVEGEGRGKRDGKGEAHGRAGDIGNAALPPAAPPFAHRLSPSIAANLPSARTGRAD